MTSLSSGSDSEGNGDIEAGTGNIQQGNVGDERASPSSNIAPHLLREAGDETGTVSQGTINADSTFSIRPQELVTLVTNSNDPSALQQRGGVQGIAFLLKTDLGKGVDGDRVDLIRRKTAFGSNTYPQKQAKPFWRLLWEGLGDARYWSLTLFAVKIFTAKARVRKQGLPKGVSIETAIIICIVVKGLKPYFAQYLMSSKSNQEYLHNTFMVIRSDTLVEVSSCDIVVGDVVRLNCGDDVPADGVIIESDSLTIDEFNITNKSDIVPKDSEVAPILKSGCRVENGNCTMLVTCVGINAQWGLLLDKIPAEDTVTHLQECLSRIVNIFASSGIVTAFIFMAILLIRLFTGRIKNAVGIPAFIWGKTKFGDAIISAIEIAEIGVIIPIIAVPGSFALLVPLSEIYLIRKIVKYAKLRKISACESMAHATTICFHSTGTSIENPHRDQVMQLQMAGVKIRMITGQNLEIARRIALEYGILGSDESQQSEPNVIDGSVFRSKTDGEREQIADKITVMFQASSMDKLLLVKALMKNGEVVAYWGHDSGDASALLQADVSITSARGTSFAKHNSDIILHDDSFASVLEVIRSGRAVYANIKKILLLQLPVNIAVVIFTLVAVVHCNVPLIDTVQAVSFCRAPISAVQILWISFFLIPVGSLALAMEHPTADLMLGRIDPRNTLTNSMLMNILVQVIYQVTVILVLYYQGSNIMNLKQDTEDHANKLMNTMMFNVSVLCQIFNIFNARNVGYNIFKGITSNFVFIVLVGVAVVTQVIIIQFGQTPFDTVVLNKKRWLISVGIGIMSWPLAVIGKMLPVPHFTKLWTKLVTYLLCCVG